MPRSDSPIYHALALPSAALDNGGLEILRAGLIDDELFVSALRVFKDPAQWGDVLADITQRLGVLYSAETDFSEKQVVAAIESAFAAGLGAPPVKTARHTAKQGRKPPLKRAKRKKS